MFIGPSAELLYGARNYMELLSVFDSPPLFRVEWGNRDLGSVHELSLQRRHNGENAEAAVQSARDSRDLVTLAVGGSYLQIIATQARIAAAHAQVESSQAIFQQASDRLAAGLDTRIDATRAEVQLDKERLRSLQGDRERQKLQLARLIGLPRGQQFTVAEDFPFSPVTGLTLEQALVQADHNRADLRAAAAAAKAVEKW
jgi:outer membrane protein TolC